MSVFELPGRQPVAPGVLRAPVPAPRVLALSAGRAEGSRAAAAALACAAADPGRCSLLVELGGRPPRPTLLASAAARRLEDEMSERSPGIEIAARGQVCHLVPVHRELEEAMAEAARALSLAREHPAVVTVPSPSAQAAIERLELDAALIRADLPSDLPIAALLVRGMLRRGLRVAVLKRRLGWVAERRALFGVGGAGGEAQLPDWIARRLLEPGTRDWAEEAA